MAEKLTETPLFPLDVVLVPGMALPLHVFEPRYRRMTGECLDSNAQIGVVLALPGSALGQEIPARVGTLARIVDYERLPDGRYNLLAVGTQRFEIVELRHERPYLSALVRLLDDDAPGDLDTLMREARATLDEYLRRVLTLVGSEECDIGIPDDPASLSYVVVMCLAHDDAEKQRLLEVSSVARRLEQGIELLRADVAELRRQAERTPHPPSEERRSALN